MVEITAALVKTLRERTGLPMMDCKKALEATGGKMDEAIEWLRKRGEKIKEKQSGRKTETGRIAAYARLQPGVGAMVELRCETAPVANNAEFIQLANNLVTQLAQGPGAATPAELLAQPSPGKPGQTLQQQYDDLYNRIREAFELRRVVRIDGPCGAYVHHDGRIGALVQVQGGNAELAKEICMHLAFRKPSALTKEDLDPALVAKEREIQVEIARKEGKPENIIQKMIEGRMRNFYADQCLLDQPFIKDESKTVAKVVQEAGMKIVRFVLWEIGKE
jgi:elongation factor Ts